jgi:hypothetical protein
MAPASQLPGSRNAAAWFARIFSHAHALAPLPIVVVLLAPATVLGDIYKWTDEKGNTVISNVQPASTAKTSGMELLAKETRPAAPAAGAASTRTEQALQARIENLERQLQVQQAQGVPQPGYPQDYYPGQPSPGPDPNYYSGYDPNYYGSYDPNYSSGYDPFYSSGYYPYGVPLAYSFIAVPARPLHRHRFVNRPPAVVNPLRNASRPPAVMGQPPAITGRPPVFTGRPPVFVTRSQAFMSQPAPGFSRSAASAGGAMHSARR